MNGHVAMAEALIEKHGANVEAVDKVRRAANGRALVVTCGRRLV